MEAERHQAIAIKHTNNWQMGKSINDCMLRLFHTNLWSDVSFVCKDQDRNNLDDRVRAHKMVLAARSQVFQAMFYGPCASTQENVHLDDIEADDFKLFLIYLYSDSTDLTSADTATSVMQIAHKYQVSSLLKYCCNYLASITNTDNACDILQLALFYEEEVLIGKVIDYIDDHAEEVLQTASFVLLNPASLMYILKGDTLFVPESKIFQAAIKWARGQCVKDGIAVNGQAIRNVLGEMFYQLRTPAMGAMEFFECTFMQGYYTLEEYEKILALITGYASDISLPCNSSIPRKPRTQIAKIDSLPGNTSDTKSISCEISLIASEDIRLQGFLLSSMHAVCSHYRSYSSTIDVALAFNGVVTIEGQAFPFETAVGKDPKQFVMLTTPFLFKKSGTEYNIKLQMVCITSQLVQVPYVRASSKAFDVPSQHLKISYKNLDNIDNHVVIGAFKYENMSKR